MLRQSARGEWRSIFLPQSGCKAKESLPSDKPGKRQKGSILLELLLCAGIIAGLGSWLFVSSEALLQLYYKNQVRFIAYMLASDLRELQRRSLFPVATGTLSLQTSASKDTLYGIYKDRSVSRRIEFNTYLCPEVYLDEKISSVYFSANGAPSYEGIYRLRHHKVKDFSCKVAVEPVSGRVRTYEEK